MHYMSLVLAKDNKRLKPRCPPPRPTKRERERERDRTKEQEEEGGQRGMGALLGFVGSPNQHSPSAIALCQTEFSRRNSQRRSQRIILKELLFLSCCGGSGRRHDQSSTEDRVNTILPQS